MNRRLFFICVIAALVLPTLLFVSCRRNPIRHSLPEGVQTISGLLQPVSISNTRRGTHVIIQSGSSVFYIQSSTVNLRTYEGGEVTVRGMVEENIDADDLPVLTAIEVVPRERKVRSWNVSSQRLSLSVPEDWKGSQTENGMEFVSGSAAVLSIASESGGVVPQGFAVVVGGERASIVTEANALVATVDRGAFVLRFRLFATTSVHEGALRQELLHILQSVRFSGLPTHTSSGSGAQTGGKPCGGPAGLLCPPGQYCEVTDTTADIGRCRVLQH